MLVVSRTLLSVAALALIVASACGDEDTSAPGTANAGAAPTGGAPATGGTSPNAGAPDGGLRSQSGSGGAPAARGSGSSGGADEAGQAGITPESGGVAGAGGAIAGPGGIVGAGGRDGATGGVGGEEASGGGGQRSAGGHAGGEHDFNLGGMDGIGGTFCWWPGIEEEDVGELIQAYDLPEDVEACAQEQCDSTECEHRSGWQWCADCTPGHDECRCACYQLYSECGDCDALGMCISYCLVMHC